jgi:DNA-binding CsgD family transcriptional regulator
MLAEETSVVGGSGKFEPDHLLLVGSSCVFPDVTLRLLRLEFEGVGASRIDNPNLDVALPLKASLRLVVVDDRFADLIEARYGDLQRHFGGAQIALGYRDVETARRLFTLQQSRGQLDGLRFIPTDTPVGGWVSMLRLLLEGGYFVPGDLVEQARPPRRAPPATGLPPVSSALAKKLTQREIEVLAQVAKGRRNKKIAEDLGVSEHTVKLHLHHIIAKIGVQNRTAAANWYLAQGAADGDGVARPDP